ncbi:isochorismatase family protein [Saccharibacter floricola]|uniref:nicotinamidase n=1 Tax=Saccharibacter floricola DSM 15669 TaxID=1123227 RepID=A0ABQ0NVQ4_9PROT|nr:isochorismatase family protein [Saccharibacter floricola]GBQ04492.1 nicotinamidase [Saccharibacter floricola DSM 15669]
MTFFTPRAGDALLVIDMQNDFLPGGALAVPGGDALIPGINRLMHSSFDAIIASQDWHPANHTSFKEQYGQWPAHCIAGTHGAALHKELHQVPISHIIHKGMRAKAECYSAFADESGASTGLSGLLTGLGIRRVVLCGVALDYCVRASALDSLNAGFETVVLTNLCAAIGEQKPLLQAMQSDGLTLLEAKERLS